jgi:maltose 6'-phosphate phosphatase
MKNKIQKKGSFRIFMALVAVLLSAACSHDLETGNQPPAIDISTDSDGLQVTLSGKITDPDGTLSVLRVNWGDNLPDYQVYADSNALEITHLYAEPAVYNITVTASDNIGDSTTKTISLTLDYKETLLNGIKESMYKAAPNEYLILTINMHTYQETRQNEKFNLITDVISKMNIDFIALQECAQNNSSEIKTGIIREDNMALIISDRLKSKYNTEYTFIWNWSHYGWNVWEEGVAILSKYPLKSSEDRYISTFTGTSDITSRKVIFGSYETSNGMFNIFSAHTHWRLSLLDEEQDNQIKKIKLMAAEKSASTPDTPTIVCGDFNGNPTSDYPWSEGYNTMMKDNEYSDTFLNIYPDANTLPAQSIYNTIGGDFPGRIDYIFAKKNPHLKVIDSQIIFTKEIVGTVSDHFAVLTKLAYVE